MPYIEPTVCRFKARYPEFDVVNDVLVLMVLEEVIPEIGECWLDKDRARAQTLLTAHRLTMEGEPNRSQSLKDGATPASPMSGQIIEFKDRDASVKFADKSKNKSSSDSGKGSIVEGYEQTPYGREYLILLRRNSRSVIAV